MSFIIKKKNSVIDKFYTPPIYPEFRLWVTDREKAHIFQTKEEAIRTIAKEELNGEPHEL